MRQMHGGAAYYAVAWCASLAAAMLAGTPAARAQGVYFTTRSVLRQLFASSERVSYVVVETARVKTRLAGLLGYVPAKAKYTVFVARTGDRIDGYAVIDEEIGQHLPITFAVALAPDGSVRRTEVMAYHEAYGSDIRQERFRAQFVGKRVGDPVRVGRDIQAVSGATISSRSMAVAVRRAAALVMVLRETERLDTPLPSQRGGPGHAGSADRTAD
ncbi:MAG: FMN-binding protein [Myxococcota bacterium]